MSDPFQSPRARGAFAALALAAALLSAPPAFAQMTIAALVNGSPITSTEVSERRAFVRLTQKKEISPKQALENLIDDVLVQQEARRRQLPISEAEVDQRFAALATNTKLSPEQLTAALSQAGASARTFKASIRTQILQRKLIAFRLRTTSGVNEKDVALQLTERKQQGQATNHRYQLQQIIFVVPAGSGAGVVAQRRQEAEGLRTRIQDCAQGAAFAKGLRDVAVKEPITRVTSQLGTAFREEVQTTKVGRATKPELKDVGVEIVMICEKVEIEDDTALRQQIQAELIGEAGKGESDKFIAELRQKALIQYK